MDNFVQWPLSIELQLASGCFTNERFFFIVFNELSLLLKQAQAGWWDTNIISTLWHFNGITHIDKY